jgi:hypothetical protein
MHFVNQPHHTETLVETNIKNTSMAEISTNQNNQENPNKSHIP